MIEEHLSGESVYVVLPVVVRGHGGDYDHTGVYVGNGWVIEANAYYGEVRYSTISLNGTEYSPLFVDVLAANGYGN